MIAVRSAVSTNYPAMADLLRAAEFAAHAQQLELAFARGYQMEEGWFVADEEIVGVAHAELAIDYSDLITGLGFNPPHTFISAIVVGNGHRRSGVGRILLTGVAAAGANLGSSFLALVPEPSDNESNDPASFFRRCGLKPLEPEMESVPARYGVPIAKLVNY